jgi:hypothetical protein
MLQSQKATAPALCFRRSKEEDGQLPSADKALEIHFDRAVQGNVEGRELRESNSQAKCGLHSTCERSSST